MFDPQSLLNGAAIDLPVVSVLVPEWDGLAHLATLTAEQRDQLEEAWQEIRSTEESVVGFRSWVVAFCLCDEEGAFAFPRLEDRKAAAAGMNRRNCVPVCRLFNKACEMNGLLASDVEELEKNLEATTTACGSGD